MMLSTAVRVAGRVASPAPVAVAVRAKLHSSATAGAGKVNDVYRPGVPMRPCSETPGFCSRTPCICADNAESKAHIKKVLADHAEREWSPEEVQANTEKHAMYTWGMQGAMSKSAIQMSRADGVYFIDTKGKRYLDFSSQAMCVNMGHSASQSVIDAVVKQMQELPYAYPGISAVPIRAKLCKLLSDICPGDIDHFMFPSSGAEANEAAMRMARLYTGRNKIFSRYRSYHGGTNATLALTGEFRRWGVEPSSMPNVVHFFDPYPYSFRWGETEEEITERNLAALHEQLKYENPKDVAAIHIESITGTNGVLKPPKGYLEGLRRICDEHGILLVCDEVMAGFGRSGRFFGFCHSPTVVPDIVTFAKGINGAMIPMGGVGVRSKIHEHFKTAPVGYGSTYNGHPVALASAYAIIKEMLERDIVGHAARMEVHMRDGLQMLQDKHPSVRQTRVTGLFGGFDLQKNRRGDFLAEVHEPMHPALAKFKQATLDAGMFTMMRGHQVFTCPPLISSPAEIAEGFDILDRCLHHIDEAMED